MRAPRHWTHFWATQTNACRHCGDSIREINGHNRPVLTKHENICGRLMALDLFGEPVSHIATRLKCAESTVRRARARQAERMRRARSVA